MPSERIIHLPEHASELNLGHLVHQADNYRGSFRGTGTELRTDAWGALRAGRGIVMSTWCVGPGEAAGDMAPAMALLKQAASLARTLSDAAGTHRTVKLAAAIGSTGPDKSVIDEGAAPLNALHKAASGMVDAKDQDAALGDAQAKNTATSQGKVPHLTAAAIIQAAKAGFGCPITTKARKSKSKRRMTSRAASSASSRRAHLLNRSLS